MSGPDCCVCDTKGMEHRWMSQEEIDRYRDKDMKVWLCGTDKNGMVYGRVSLERWEDRTTYMGHKIEPDDPCDEEFMEEISS